MPQHLELGLDTFGDVTAGSSPTRQSARKDPPFGSAPHESDALPHDLLTNAAHLVRRVGDTAPERRKGSIPKNDRAHKKSVKAEFRSIPERFARRSRDSSCGVEGAYEMTSGISRATAPLSSVCFLDATAAMLGSMARARLRPLSDKRAGEKPLAVNVHH